MRCKITGTLALLLATAAIVGSQDWAGHGRLQGIVNSADGAPIEGAKVTLFLVEEGNGPAEPIVTDKKGRWSYLGLATGSWTFVVEAPGLKAAEGVVTVISGGLGPGQTLRVTLNPIPEELLKEAAASDPRMLVEKANTLLAEGKYAEARKAYEEALAGVEDVTMHPPILQAIANTYYQEGNAEAAIATLDKAFDVVPEDQNTLKLLVTLLVNEGREDEAEVYRARITEDFKLDPNAILNNGIEAFNRGDVETAMTYFQQVVTENPDYPDGYYYRALALLNQGKSDEARADLEKFLELDPDNDLAGDVKAILEAL